LICWNEHLLRQNWYRINFKCHTITLSICTQSCIINDDKNLECGIEMHKNTCILCKWYSKNSSHCFHSAKLVNGNFIKILSIEYYHSLTVWILAYLGSFSKSYRVQNYNWLYRICWSWAISTSSTQTILYVALSFSWWFSLVNFMYIALQIF
jgi:hypothetical protein